MDDSTIAVNVLSRVFNQLGFPGINMVDFQDRLRYQKIVYLMQNFGLSLGYGYSWYVRGPYSPDLTKDLFTISNDPSIFSHGRDLKFKEEAAVVSKIGAFKKILGEDLKDPLFLEVLASMVFIKKAHREKKLGNDELKTLLLTLKPRLKQEPNFDTTLNKACLRISEFN